MNPGQYIEEGMQFAEKAVSHDQLGDYGVAHFFYIEASEAILKAISLDPSLSAAKLKALQYIERAETLQNLLKNGKM